MKRYIYTILAALTLLAAMSAFHSCNKPVEIDITPIDNGKTGNNNGQNTNPPAGQTPADVTLLIEAGKACEFNGYTTTAEAAVFYFDTEKDEWKEVAVRNENIKKIDDSEETCTVTFTNNESIELKYQNAVTLSLEKETEISGYPGEEEEIAFSVIKKGRGLDKISVSAEGCVTIADFNETTGEGTAKVLFPADAGSAMTGSVTVTDGTNKSIYNIKAKTYYFDVTASDIVLDGNAGSKVDVTYAVSTDIPEYEVTLTLEENVPFVLSGNSVASTEENHTGSDIVARLYIGENTGKMTPKVITITQKTLGPQAKEGCVPFTDWEMKNACLAVADKDNDGEISYEEALAVKVLDISGKNVNNLDGLEYFKKIEELDCSNNNIEVVWLDDISAYSNLKKINCLDNPLKKVVNISGCYAGPSFECKYPKYAGTRINLAKYYSSEDFSHNGVKTIQKHTEGKGIHLFLYSWGFLDKDYESGAAEEYANAQMDTLFSYEPFKSLRGYFDIYHVQIVAKDINTEGELGDVEWIEDDGEQHWKMSIRINEIDLDPDWTEIRAGCQGGFPFNTYISLCQKRMYSIANSITHEMGHAIGNLKDQYIEGNKTKIRTNRPNACPKENADNVPWKRFFEYEQYKNRVGIYENENGLYPSPDSIMGDRQKYRYFDSPSRYAIFKNIHYASQYEGGKYDIDSDDEQTWQMFLEYDVINNHLPY